MPRARAASSRSAPAYAGVSGVLGGSQARGGEHVVHGLCHRGVRHGRGGGGHVRDQVRGCCPPGRQPAGGSRAARARGCAGVRVAAGLAEVDLVPLIPGLAALFWKYRASRS